MNDKLKEVIKEFEKQNLAFNDLLKNYDSLGHNEKLNLVSKLSVYLLFEKRMAKEESEKIIDLFLLDIKKMRQQKKRIRRMRNNYDSYMYTVHHLHYHKNVYKDVIYDLDNYEERETFIALLKAQRIIKKVKGNYMFIDKKIVKLLKEYYLFKEEDNGNLCDRAVIINLQEIGVLRKL